MSWSVSFIGKPERVAEALEKHGESLSGQSKVEYDAAKPHLVALVKENFAKDGSGYPQLLRLEANGSGTGGGEQLQRQCGVKLEPIWGQLLV